MAVPVPPKAPCLARGFCGLEPAPGPTHLLGLGLGLGLGAAAIGVVALAAWGRQSEEPALAMLATIGITTPSTTSPTFGGSGA